MSSEQANEGQLIDCACGDPDAPYVHHREDNPCIALPANQDGERERAEAIKVKFCGKCGWPNLKPNEAMGTVPDLNNCPDCGAVLSAYEIPAGVIQPRKDFGPLRISDLATPDDNVEAAERCGCEELGQECEYGCDGPCENLHHWKDRAGYWFHVAENTARPTSTEPGEERARVDGCPFCDYAGPSEVLARYAPEGYLTEAVYVIEPLNPVTEGHVLVIPERHVDHFLNNTHVTGLCATVAADWARKQGFDRDYNLITSKGAAATQTVGHLHFHLVPRREGDGLSLPWSEPAPPDPAPEAWDGERCQSCGAPYAIVWAAENDLWNAVVGQPAGLRCPDCFDREAREAGFSPYWAVADGHFLIDANHKPAPEARAADELAEAVERVCEEYEPHIGTNWVGAGMAENIVTALRQALARYRQGDTE